MDEEMIADMTNMDIEAIDLQNMGDIKTMGILQYRSGVALNMNDADLSLYLQIEGFELIDLIDHQSMEDIPKVTMNFLTADESEGIKLAFTLAMSSLSQRPVQRRLLGTVFNVMISDLKRDGLFSNEED